MLCAERWSSARVVHGLQVVGRWAKAKNGISRAELTSASYTGKQVGET